MFDQIDGLPLHPLVIHAAVLGVPVTLLLAVLFAIPRTRDWARWPLAVAGVGSFVAVLVARQSGQALAAVVVTPESPIAPLINQHAQLAGQLQGMTAVLAVLTLASAFLVGRVGGTPERRGSRGRDAVLMALLVVVAAVTAFWVYRVGDIGATAVWNPTGTQDYSAPGR